MMKHLVQRCVTLLLLAAPGARADAPIATASGVLFRCQAPGVSAMYLAGSFNNWADNDDGRITNDAFRMKGPDASGTFSKVVPLAAGAYKFQFAAEGTKGRWFVPDEMAERDADGNALLRVAHDGRVMIRGARNPDWRPRVTAQGAHFRFYAPEAHVIYLAGSFNRWADNNGGLVSDPRFAMKGPASDGTWTALVKLPAGTHAYQFVIDGDRWVRDPNELQADDQNHSIMVVP